MPALSDSVDLMWNDQGDLMKDPGGDLQSTEADTLIPLRADVRAILNSSYGDFEKNPYFSASLEEFIGMPNNRDTAKSIEDRVKSILVTNRIAIQQDITVRVVPVSYDEVIVLIGVQALPTVYNGLQDNEKVVLSFSFNMKSGYTTFVEDKTSMNMKPRRGH
jgi:hypothetical protein